MQKLVTKNVASGSGACDGDEVVCTSAATSPTSISSPTEACKYNQMYESLNAEADNFDSAEGTLHSNNYS